MKENNKGDPYRKESDQDGSLHHKKGKEVEKVHEVRTTHHTFNTIVGRFAGGEETNSSWKKYSRTIMHISETMVPYNENDFAPFGF